MKTFVAIGLLVMGLGIAPLSAQPSAPSPVAVDSSLLAPGLALLPGDAVFSDDGNFMFLFQDDGNLVLYGPGGPLWASGTDGTTFPGFVLMQLDGNLVIYNDDGNPIWASNTVGNDGAFLCVQNDGNVVIYNAGGSALWATGTNVR